MKTRWCTQCAFRADNRKTAQGHSKSNDGHNRFSEVPPVEYPAEKLDDESDNGTMPESLAALEQAVVGHKIVEVQTNLPSDGSYGRGSGTALVLDNGKRVVVRDTDDCCAYTTLEGVIQNLDQIDHIVMGVGTTDEYQTWHIYADYGDILELKVGWSAGNPFYYGYGFDIQVEG